MFLGAMLLAIKQGHIEPRNGWLVMVLSLAGIYMVLERLVPYEKRWSMTARSFGNDLKYMVGNGAAIGVFSTVLGLFAITTAGQTQGIASDWPFLVQLLALVLIFEALQYGLHRFEHEGTGRIGQFFWRVHSAHHLPDKVYVAMHVAGHPINAILVQGVIIIVPIWLMGYSEMAVVVFLMINSMHGLISHFNVDARIGWMNYLFIGPELHRYHHSANASGAKNYGATMTLFDLMFGSFVYRPGTAPARLGVQDPQHYPLYGEFLRVLQLPFRSN
jgi:sterol desaturase/sphingolipid hydroxylase (fatty acid hydroxylase superfamily)